MKTLISGLAWSVVLGLGGTISAQQGGSASNTAPAALDSPAIVSRVAAIRTAAGPEWRQAVDYFCDPDPRVNDPNDPQLPPTKVFDNLYYVGAAGTGSWIVQTSQGLVMIDTGYPQHRDSVLLAGMKALNLKEADVKYILIGHDVWDHWGGAAYFQDKYGTRVLEGSLSGWRTAGVPATSPAQPSAPPQPRPQRIVAGRVAAEAPANAVAPKFDPKRDIKWTGTNVLTVGDTSFTIVDEPGGINVVFQVKDGATTHTAGLFGATVLVPGWRNVETLQEYVQILARWSELTKRMNVDVEIQNHPLFDGVSEKIAWVLSGKKGREHPFVVGTDAYQRFVNVISECAKVQIARRPTPAQ